MSARRIAPPAAARRILGARAVIGYSTHTTAQIEAAAREPISYLAIGPVFGSRTKDTGYESVGLEMVREAARLARGLPVVAIGGITLERVPSVVAAGAAGIAVIGDLLAGGPRSSSGGIPAGAAPRIIRIDFLRSIPFRATMRKTRVRRRE